MMCLDKLENFKVHKNYGWQIFKKENNNICQVFNHQHLFNHKETLITFNKWQKDINDYNLYTKEVYKTGFHIFLKKKDALAYKVDNIIKKVYFKNVVAKGIQTILYRNVDYIDAKIVVVRERWISEN